MQNELDYYRLQIYDNMIVALIIQYNKRQEYFFMLLVLVKLSS